FAYANCTKPIVAVCGSYGRTTISHMIAYTLRVDKKNVFVGGTSDEPFINYLMMPNRDEIDYVVVEVSPLQLQTVPNFKPIMAIYPNLEEKVVPGRFKGPGEFLDTALKVARDLGPNDYLVVNFDKLAGNSILRNCQ